MVSTNRVIGIIVAVVVVIVVVETVVVVAVVIVAVVVIIIIINVKRCTLKHLTTYIHIFVKCYQ